MATFTKLPPGSWRAQVRRKGKYASETFLRRSDAETWARNVEHKIDRGEPILCDPDATKTFAGLIELHRENLRQVGNAIGRSKTASLDFLTERLGKLHPVELDRERTIEFGKERSKEGAVASCRFRGHRDRVGTGEWEFEEGSSAVSSSLRQ